MIALIAAVIIVVVSWIRFSGGSGATSASADNAATQPQKAESGEKGAFIPYGRIVLTMKPQTIVVPNGMTLVVAPVEDNIRAVKIVNGNLNMGTNVFMRSSTVTLRSYQTTINELTRSYYAPDSGEVGKSLVFHLFPEGHVDPDTDKWIGYVIAKTM